ncbi:2'-5' RNA ligase family protein [Lactiplantibacillus plajomi]|uniref:2'-5' RNA ligase family protein n=1 Tax=Lactiplantibacillus plajomi TaxID=1457217 RepID=A0ABV6K1D7_9LACO|nr:2'-5' RNA ligase family protein [Lactiplantibacillus plajomi]
MRTILIFPTIPPTVSATIYQIRQQYDPLAPHIRPHLSLVFPFESSLSDAQLTRLIRAMVAKLSPFELTLDHLGTDHHGYFWLRVTTGNLLLTQLHDQLYADANLAPFLRSDLPYHPHLTLGHVAPTAVPAILARLAPLPLKFTTTVTTISAEHILANGDSDEVIRVILTQ